MAKLRFSVTSTLNGYEQEQEQDEDLWNCSHNPEKENLQTIAGIRGKQVD
ncbi:hypothetical protein JB92DRAFT_3118405 [Gautieria morchelliformis]|nr:hypothetical protein JB92DRAFT_3118405 [Gautieria morchelliformis]